MTNKNRPMTSSRVKRPRILPINPADLPPPTRRRPKRMGPREKRMEMRRIKKRIESCSEEQKLKYNTLNKNNTIQPQIKFFIP